MSSDTSRYQRFREAVPYFFAQTEQVFGFLETKYRYRLHAHMVTDLEFPPDTYARVSFVGLHVETRIWWYFYSASISVSFTALKVPRVSEERAVFFGDTKDAALAIDLWTLASFLGHPDDPDFLLGHEEPSLNESMRASGIKESIKQTLESIRERDEIIHTNMSGVLEGLARATERYGHKILRGDTTIFPDVMGYYSQRLQERGAMT